MILKIKKESREVMRGEKFAEWGVVQRLGYIATLLVPLWVVVVWGS